MNTWPKKCGCGTEHYAGSWTELSFVGFMDDGDGGRIEMRDCGCGSTIAVEVEPTGLPWTMAQDLARLFAVEADRVDGFSDPYEWPPQPRRKVSADDRTEALRLASISDALTMRVRAWRDRERAASDSDAPEAA